MGNTPVWLDEGFAEYASLKLSGVDFLDRKIMGKNYYRQLYRFKNLPKVDVIVKKRDYSIESYILWRGVVQFLFEFGGGKYLTFLKGYVDLVTHENFKSDPFREAFASVLGPLEEDWIQFVGESWKESETIKALPSKN
jgi:hypothetical protein